MEAKTWVAKDRDGREFVFDEQPYRSRQSGSWLMNQDGMAIELPEGSIQKLIGISVTWDSDCVELK